MTILIELKKLIDRAEKGDAEAQFRLGWAYANADGLPKDEKLAEKWLTLAAEQGNADHQFWLGWTYANANGLPKDEKLAEKWFTRAAVQGNAGCRFMLGKWHGKDGGGLTKDGGGLTKDGQLAKYWFARYLKVTA